MTRDEIRTIELLMDAVYMSQHRAFRTVENLHPDDPSRVTVRWYNEEDLEPLTYTEAISRLRG